MMNAFFNFTKNQRKGIVGLLLLILLIQAAFFMINFGATKGVTSTEKQWLQNQKLLELQKAQLPQTEKIYPFNPNFITDFKGYKLGMKPEEIDRLLAYRKQNKFVNSAQEFQQVTGVSDSLLQAILPYFKFPDWVKNKSAQKNYPNEYSKEWKDYSKKPTPTILDINQATKEDLMKIYGIGDAISDRILKQKELLGNFVSMQQMEDVWGLSPEVIEKLNQSFKVIQKPNTKKININEATIKELGQFPYFKYPISKNIVAYRSMNGGTINKDDLTKIKDFPVDKIQIIALYLEF